MSHRLISLLGVCLLSAAVSAAEEYHVFAGSTHAHTAYTWSHGEQWAKSGCAGIMVYGPSTANPVAYTWTPGYVQSKNGCSGIYVINGFQFPSPSVKLRPDWETVQGPPSVHYRVAKEKGYDFYVTSDHSQEAAFQPPSPDNEQWLASKHQAAQSSSADFLAMAGFEFSENDGPGGRGHINVINTSGIINALAPGVDLPHFYRWLHTAKPNGDGAVVATFNHPGPDQYNNWADRDPQVTDIITMLEVINSNNKIHYQGFINALDHGWKVSPVCGNDNHGLTGISKNTSRTFVLAKDRSKVAILDAMKNRRTYASLDENLQARYSVNGAIMGSTLRSPRSLRFDITVSDPDTSSPKDKITKIDIVKDHGAVVQEYTPEPGYSIHWTPEIQDTDGKYFFVRVWTAGGGDAPGADPEKPVAWLAPVWTGR
jgi:hypothetical protein